MHGDYVGLRKELILRDMAHAEFSCALGREIRAPCDYGHAKRLAVFRHILAEPPETEHAERFAGERFGHDMLLPAAATHGLLTLRQFLRQREDKSPRNFRRGTLSVF